MQSGKKDLQASVEFDEKEIQCKPVTSANWPDLEALFSERGVQRNCWCMYWRVPRADFTRHYGEGNKHSLKMITDSGIVPGILAYHRDRAVGWCSVAPRQDFTVLGRSSTLKPVDDKPVWSIVCFFVTQEYRHKGLNSLLIKAAVDYAKDNGAHIVEAYPIDEGSKSIEFERYTGLTSTFLKLGFVEAVRRSDRRPVLRYYVKE